MCVFKATMVLIAYGTMQNNFGTVEKVSRDDDC
jgi:hypothetical protein